MKQISFKGLSTNLIFVVGLGLFSALANAQSDLVELQSKLHNLSSYQAQFTQQVVDGEGELLQESTGILQLQQPNLMRWEVIEPEENTLIADGTTLWHIDPFVEQVTAMDQQQSIANNPIILLTDVNGDNWQNFNVTRTDKDYVIESKDPQSQIKSLTLVFKREQLVKLSFLDRQLQQSTLTFFDIQQNQPVEDKQFQFVLPEGFELDDQR